MTRYPFGNDPAKIERYRAFWDRAPATRPLIGFSFADWFPLHEFAACRPWQEIEHLEAGMIDPKAFLPDHLRLLEEGEVIEDDMIRGACPAQLAFPWLAGMLDCRVRILPGTVIGEDMHFGWDRALETRLDRNHPWFRKYLEYADALVGLAAGRFPISHAAEIGPTDLHAMLRGHTESLLDLMDQPENSACLLQRMGEIFCDVTEAVWKRLPLFYGGYFDAQYSLWAPNSIVRMQEDATAIYSPALYRRYVQPVDRMIARRFGSSFIHLHSTSMFLLDAILEIEEIRCYEVNNDALGPPVAEMIPHFRRIQQANRPLLIRGAFTPEELKLVTGSLDPRGLFLNVMVKNLREIDELRPAVRM